MEELDRQIEKKRSELEKAREELKELELLKAQRESLEPKAQRESLESKAVAPSSTSSALPSDKEDILSKLEGTKKQSRHFVDLHCAGCGCKIVDRQAIYYYHHDQRDEKNRNDSRFWATEAWPKGNSEGKILLVKNSYFEGNEYKGLFRRGYCPNCRKEIGRFYSGALAWSDPSDSEETGLWCIDTHQFKSAHQLVEAYEVEDESWKDHEVLPNPRFTDRTIREELDSWTELWNGPFPSGRGDPCRDIAAMICSHLQQVIRLRLQPEERLKALLKREDEVSQFLQQLNSKLQVTKTFVFAEELRSFIGDNDSLTPDIESKLVSLIFEAYHSPKQLQSCFGPIFKLARYKLGYTPAQLRQMFPYEQMKKLDPPAISFWREYLGVVNFIGKCSEIFGETLTDWPLGALVEAFIQVVKQNSIVKPPQSEIIDAVQQLPSEQKATLLLHLSNKTKKAGKRELVVGLMIKIYRDFPMIAALLITEKVGESEIQKALVVAREGADKFLERGDLRDLFFVACRLAKYYGSKGDFAEVEAVQCLCEAILEWRATIEGVLKEFKTHNINNPVKPQASSSTSSKASSSSSSKASSSSSSSGGILQLVVGRGQHAKGNRSNEHSVRSDVEGFLKKLRMAPKLMDGNSGALSLNASDIQNHLDKNLWMQAMKIQDPPQAPKNNLYIPPYRRSAPADRRFRSGSSRTKK